MGVGVGSGEYMTALINLSAQCNATQITSARVYYIKKHCKSASLRVLTTKFIANFFLFHILLDLLFFIRARGAHSFVLLVLFCLLHARPHQVNDFCFIQLPPPPARRSGMGCGTRTFKKDDLTKKNATHYYTQNYLNIIIESKKKE